MGHDLTAIWRRIIVNLLPLFMTTDLPSRSADILNRKFWQVNNSGLKTRLNKITLFQCIVYILQLNYCPIAIPRLS